MKTYHPSGTLISPKYNNPAPDSTKIYKYPSKSNVYTTSAAGFDSNNRSIPAGCVYFADLGQNEFTGGFGYFRLYHGSDYVALPLSASFIGDSFSDVDYEIVPFLAFGFEWSVTYGWYYGIFFINILQVSGPPLPDMYFYVSGAFNTSSGSHLWTTTKNLVPNLYEYFTPVNAFTITHEDTSLNNKHMAFMFSQCDPLAAQANTTYNTITNNNSVSIVSSFEYGINFAMCGFGGAPNLNRAYVTSYLASFLTRTNVLLPEQGRVRITHSPTFTFSVPVYAIEDSSGIGIRTANGNAGFLASPTVLHTLASNYAYAVPLFYKSDWGISPVCGDVLPIGVWNNIPSTYLGFSGLTCAYDTSLYPGCNAPVMVCNTNSTDSQITLTSPYGYGFIPTKYRYVEIPYITSYSGTIEFYFTGDSAAFSETNKFSAAIVNNGTWQKLRFDLWSKAAYTAFTNIKSFRLDPTNVSGATITLGTVRLIAM